MKKLKTKRQFLNKSLDLPAFIISKPSYTKRLPPWALEADEDENTRRKHIPKNHHEFIFEGGYVTLSDCSRQIELDFSIDFSWGANTKKEALKEASNTIDKLQILIDHFTAWRDAMAETHGQINSIEEVKK